MRKAWLAATLVALLATACGSVPATATVLPTLPPSATLRQLPPTWTPGSPQPVTASPTAGKALVPVFGSTALTGIPTVAQQASPTPVQTAALVPVLGATALTLLPPSFTPIPFETSTPPPFVIPTLDPILASLTPKVVGTLTATISPTPDLSRPPLALNGPVPAECSQFSEPPGKNPSIIGIKQPLSLYWNLTSIANNYRVWVLHPDQRYLFTNQTDLSEMNIPNIIFNVEGAYGWEIVAYQDSTPICHHLTGVWVVRRAPQ